MTIDNIAERHINSTNKLEPLPALLPHKELYGNLGDLIVNVLAHIDCFGNHIELDNRHKELRLGWKCGKTGQTWLINLIKVKMLGQEADNLMEQFLIKCWSALGDSQKWQLAIVQDQKIITEIKRLWKLKMFW